MSNEAPTDALRLVPVEPTWEQLVAMRDCCAELSGIEADSETMLTALYRATLKAAPASPPAYVRTPNEDDRLRRALYRLLERHGAGPDPLSVIGSLWDTLDQGECTDLIEDWLITGKVIQVEGDTDEMLASIPKEAPASPLPGVLLWMMHVRGPDDIYPAPDYETAVSWCDIANGFNGDSKSPLIRAVPAIWTGTSESHAAGLPEAIKGWTLPAAPTGDA